ncbi:MAG: DUF1775 domain-containing protein [Beijerinckiaceae bacterium]|nr:DUF1775 domain-containing protein [Beijerinckiaceae bacterium]
MDCRPLLLSPFLYAALAGAGTMASAHVGFTKRQVPLASTIDSILRVPHGCNGSPTLRLRMRLPKAVTGFRPQPKEGWTITLSGEGATREVAWSGRLSATQTGSFAVSIDIDASVKPGQIVYFPVVQECEKGVSRWIDVKGRPSADSPDDESHDESTSPAPSIRFLPRK